MGRKGKDTASVFQQKLNALIAIEDDLPSVIIIHNLETMAVEYISPRGEQILGFSLEDLKSLGKEYHTKFFNPEDVADYLPKILNLIQSNSLNDKIISYFQQARASEQHDWRWYLSTTKIFLRDGNQKPTHIITSASPIDPKHHITTKVNRLLEENNFLRRHEKVFAALSKREKEILRYMALGENSQEIAAQLHISEKTVVTHRRNIRTKLDIQSSYDITKFAQAFDLI
ncbi:LuxR C-terminal-related transcriptional regulator [Solitalea lacus]|uniref:LuxR C-terminal-related transcriptional regulator n=1 Tax=Solitalea lacus TaxID=2911172 RepID=UPI001EDA513C|nr:LuxR C-terminal-related transcriptional regulator [Solitalea lacus]UKJ07530.1 LuxR C-terminal-related transcriptional regulator [Solitalea lacus]